MILALVLGTKSPGIRYQRGQRYFALVNRTHRIL